MEEKSTGLRYVCESYSWRVFVNVETIEIKGEAQRSQSNVTHFDIQDKQSLHSYKTLVYIVLTEYKHCDVCSGFAT